MNSQMSFNSLKVKTIDYKSQESKVDLLKVKILQFYENSISCTRQCNEVASNQFFHLNKEIFTFEMI